MQYAAKVKYGQGSVEKIFEVTSISRNIGIGLIIGLLFTAMFLISNTIKITIFARRREIEIMKLVGATDWFIRWPFFLEGLWLGLLRFYSSGSHCWYCLLLCLWLSYLKNWKVILFNY